MLKIGVVGADNLAKIHVQLIRELKDLYELIGFYDPNDDIADEFEEAFKIKRFTNYDELLDAIDCIDMITPVDQHYELSALALRRSKHIFIEKPISNTVDEAKSLLSLSREASVKVQVGSTKRFNPAFIATLPLCNRPKLIESRHLIQYSSKSSASFSVMDLLLNDIDIVLCVAKSGVKKIVATGVSIFGDKLDIVNSRIEFDNGCVASLTAGRTVQENINKVHLFQKGSCLNVNFLSNELEIIRKREKEDTFNALVSGKPMVEDFNPIQEELKSFYHVIIYDKNPIISLEEGCDSLIVASKIIDLLNHSNVAINDNN